MNALQSVYEELEAMARALETMTDARGETRESSAGLAAKLGRVADRVDESYARARAALVRALVEEPELEDSVQVLRATARSLQRTALGLRDTAEEEAGSEGVGRLRSSREDPSTTLSPRGAGCEETKDGAGISSDRAAGNSDP